TDGLAKSRNFKQQVRAVRPAQRFDLLKVRVYRIFYHRRVKMKKNSFNFTAVLALTLTLGFFLAGCGDASSPGGNDGQIPAELIGEWQVKGKSYTSFEFTADALILNNDTYPASISGKTISFGSGDKIRVFCKSYDLSSDGELTMTAPDEIYFGDGSLYNDTYIKKASTETPGDITYSVSQNGNASTTTTSLTFTFSSAVSGLTAADITLGGTGVSKGGLSGSGTSYTLAITVTSAGNITVGINKSGIESTTKTVTVYKAETPNDITYSVSQNGNASTTTTSLTFTFSSAVSGLTAADITLGGTGVSKGSLSGGGTSYTLAITVTGAGNITVAITKSGIESTAKTVTVYRVSQDQNPFKGTWTSSEGDMVFEDTTFYIIGDDDDTFGTYTYTGNTAVLTEGPGSDHPGDEYPLTITGNTFTWFWFTFTKQQD
ncbi:MAG: hypothetical protein LBQ38_08680, partial [Spirochaetaceae bacterium]|nr:hypothetical protein [Spirochaetaceae bacterium]